MAAKISKLSITHEFNVPTSVSEFIDKYGLYDEDIVLTYDVETHTVTLKATVTCFD